MTSGITALNRFKFNVVSFGVKKSTTISVEKINIESVTRMMVQNRWREWNSFDVSMILWVMAKHFIMKKWNYRAINGFCT